MEANGGETAKTAARLMRLRQEMTGKAAIDADALVHKALAGATAKAMQGATVNTAGNLGHAVSLTMDTGHSLDFANKRWGIAGINYMSDLVAAGQAEVAAILPTLPTYSKSAVVAAKNMSGMALNEKGLNVQLQALAADLNNPFIMHNASARAMRQAAEARVADLKEAGALPHIANAQKNVDPARQTKADAQAALSKAVRNAQGAKATLLAAQAAFDQNPADTAAMDAVMDAIGSVENANQADDQARLAYQSNQKALIEAQTKLDDVQHKSLASVQAQVKREITELRRKQEGAGSVPTQWTIFHRMMNEMAASARADTKAGPGTGISSRADLPTSPNVSIAENNAGNEAAPLASVNGSGIMGEGHQGDTEAGAASSARDIPKLKTGKEYFGYIKEIAKRADLSFEEKVKHIQDAYSQLEDKTDGNCPSDVRFVNEIYENGYISYDWPEFFGFVQDSIRSITRDKPLPSFWFRIGPLGGSTFTTMPQNGKVPTMSNLSLPYIDNPAARHHGSFNTGDYFDVIDAIRNCDLDTMNKIRRRFELSELNIEKLNYYKGKYDYFINKVKREIGDIDATYGLMGNVAPWVIDGNVVLDGGAKQISTPFTGELLAALGLLKITK